ncbi:MAG: TraB/GumN family protein [Gammaproteobacteria bacterium]|nr:TraB/GumN family protein [Gammaproteobacteria bacterium]
MSLAERLSAPALRSLALATLFSLAGQSLSQDAYEDLQPAKALAVAPDRPQQVRAVAAGQPHDLAASVAARERCEAKAEADEACEIVRLNEERITTGREIRERVPDNRHPLFLWRFQRHDTVLYLAGSIHILKPSLYPLPPQLDAAFEQSDALVLEVDVAAIAPQEMQRRTLQYALLPAGQTLETVLPEALYSRLREHLGDYGMNPEMVSRAKPSLVMNQIVVSRLLTLGYLPDSGLESYFLSRRGERQILELENLDAQLKLLFNQPLETQVELLEETLDVADEIEPMLAGMLVAWLSGDDARFLELFKAQSGDSPLSRAFTRELLEDRNHTMAARIRDLLMVDPTDEPRTYFVLVGAAHLVGKEGIVPLLARHGITGQRVNSTDTLMETAQTP